MASTTWRLQGIDTGGAELVLNQVQPWSESGVVTPIAVTSAFQPVSGSLSNLLVADSSECVFAAADVLKPGFAIEFTFGSAVDLWGFRFAGPSAATWLLQHTFTDGLGACSVPRVEWVGEGLSPAPAYRPNFSQQMGAWVEQVTIGLRGWRKCAASWDGRVLMATPQGGSDTVWLSKDGGVTWIAQTAPGAQGWYGCAVSADGQVLLAGAASGSLWLSKDGGVTWVAQVAPGSRPWHGCAVSADGQVLLAGADSGSLWLSKDGGVTWVAQVAPGSRTWYGCAMSADGQTLFAVAGNSRLWLSKDAGVTWVEQVTPGSRTWYGCAVSADGQVLLAGASTGGLCLSKDAGVTWVEQVAPGSRAWYGCAVSADGQVLLAGAGGAAPWMSKDGGVTWVEQSAAGSLTWQGCAVSADGQILLLTATPATNLRLRIEPDPIYLPNALRTYVPQAVSVMRGVSPDKQGVLDTHAATVYQVADTEFGGNGRIYGTVERQNTPANALLRRRVRLHRSKDGLLARETWSDAQGNYRFEGIAGHYTYDVIAWDHEGQYQSVVANDLQPEPMP